MKQEIEALKARVVEMETQMARVIEFLQLNSKPVTSKRAQKIRAIDERILRDILKIKVPKK